MGSAVDELKTPVIEIRSDKRWAKLSLAELWTYRYLFIALVWRDVTVRYKQSIIGILWAVLQPALMMILLTIVFGRMVGLRSGGIAYPIFSYCGLLSWHLFARGMTSASASLVTNETIITKVYFPRILVPSASLATGFVDFVIAFAVLLPLMVWYEVPFSPMQAVYPAFVLLNIVVALGVAYVLSILDAVYRDVRLALPFLTQLAFFASPVVYSSLEVPQQYQWIYWLNPMTAVLEGTRWTLLGYPSPPTELLALSICSGLAFFAVGVVFFTNMERKIVDRI